MPPNVSRQREKRDHTTRNQLAGGNAIDSSDGWMPQPISARRRMPPNRCVCWEGCAARPRAARLYLVNSDCQRASVTRTKHKERVLSLRGLGAACSCLICEVVSFCLFAVALKDFFCGLMSQACVTVSLSSPPLSLVRRPHLTRDERSQANAHWATKPPPLWYSAMFFKNRGGWV